MFNFWALGSKLACIQQFILGLGYVIFYVPMFSYWVCIMLKKRNTQEYAHIKQHPIKFRICIMFHILCMMLHIFLYLTIHFFIFCEKYITKLHSCNAMDNHVFRTGNSV